MDLRDGSQVLALGIWQSQCSPTLVLVHGMGGSSRSTYMLGLSHKAYREGWNVVLLNLYNVNSNLPRPKIFHAGASREVGEIVTKLCRRFQLNAVFLVGISMGGNILLKLAGEWRHRIPDGVLALATISPLADLTNSWEIMEKLSNRVFQFHYVRGLKRWVKEWSHRLTPFVDVRAVLGAQTIREFDEHFTVPLCGFSDAFDYYRQSSAAPLLQDISIPTLVIHSRDDPFLSSEPFTRLVAQSNPWLLVCLTRWGGHVGFWEQRRWDIDRCWAENRVIDFFRLKHARI